MTIAPPALRLSFPAVLCATAFVLLFARSMTAHGSEIPVMHTQKDDLGFEEVPLRPPLPEVRWFCVQIGLPEGSGFSRLSVILFLSDCS